MSNKTAHELAVAHWEYVRGVIMQEIGDDMGKKLTLTVQEYVDTVGFHYKTAFEHGFKHGEE